MGAWAENAVRALQQAFIAAADAERAEGMRAYMRDQFPFIGIPSPERRRLARAALGASGKPNAEELLATVEALWALAEREYQYAASDLLARHAKLLQPEHLPRVRQLILTKSWWDTVDALAAQVVGAMVATHPELATAMDEWAESDELWLARTAILHQLGYKERTDEERLFRYCLANAANPDFFMRKAIGWALREYTKTAPDAVRRFVEAHREQLSPLSRREALRRIGGERA